MKVWDNKYKTYPFYLWGNIEELNEDKTYWNDLQGYADELSYYTKDLEDSILEIDSVEELQELKESIRKFKEKNW